MASVVLFLILPMRQALTLHCALLGAWYANQTASSHRANILAPVYENHVLSIDGQVCSLVTRNARSSQFEFCASRIEKSPGQVLLGERRLRLSAAADAPLAAGQWLRVSAKLKRPLGSVNPAGSVYEQYLFYRRIVATGWVRKVEQVLSDSKVSGADWQSNWLTQRVRMIAHLRELTHGLQHPGILQALVLGDRSKISLAERRILSETGTFHLMAISGLHIGLILLLLWRFLPSTAPGLVVLAMVGLVYVALVGFAPSAIRAWLMCCILLLMRIGVIRKHWVEALLIAASLLLVIDPMAPLSMGFGLSFLTVSFLVFFARAGWLEQSKGLRALVLVQVGFIFFLIPVNALYGLPHNLASIPANLIAIPWISCVILPGALLSSLAAVFSPDVAIAGMHFLDACLGGLFVFLQNLESLPGELNLEPSIWRLASFVLVLFVVLWLGRMIPASFVLMVCLTLSAFVLTRTQVEQERLIVLDVGQGLSVLIQYQQQNWLYDLGAAYESGSSFERAVLPLQRASFPNTDLSGLIVSHGDSDHAGDLAFAVSSLNPVIRVSGQVERLPVSGFSPCYEGQRWQYPQLSMTMLYPRPGDLADNANNHSCVVMLVFKGKRFLLMGDLEGDAEKLLVRRYGKKLKADVLIAGHHGSANASSYALLKAVRPEVVVCSAGYRNRFGHPHESTIRRAQSVGARTFSTADEGALVFEPGDRSIQIQSMRDQRRAYWLTH